MTAILNFILSANWGAIFGVISLVIFLGEVALNFIQRLHVLKPSTKNDWIHRALQVAMTLENQTIGSHVPEQTLPLIVDSANAFLKLHGVGVKLDAKTAELMLADLLNTLKTTPPPAK